jgi:hypothetical protein
MGDYVDAFMVGAGVLLMGFLASAFTVIFYRGRRSREHRRLSAKARSKSTMVALSGEGDNSLKSGRRRKRRSKPNLRIDLASEPDE